MAERKAKTMSRSRNQLATSYAPGSFFTFEGGLGACISRSATGDALSLDEATREQILERLTELGRAWFDAARGCREGDAGIQPQPAQCVDERLLDGSRTRFQVPGLDRVALMKPTHMGYSPAPLAFVCRRCSLFRDYDTVRALDADLERLETTVCRAPGATGPCDWEQLDVIFVHWSGSWCKPFPGQFHWDNNEKRVQKRRDSCVCGSWDFKLNRRSPRIGAWFFECARCNTPLSAKWLQNDEDTLGILGPRVGDVPFTEVRMEATPYRASNAYYVKSDLFIDFKEGADALLSRLRPGNEALLADFVAERYGFPCAAITDDDVRAACEHREDCRREWLEYQEAARAINMAQTMTPEQRKAFEPLLAPAYNNRKRILADLRARNIVVPKVSLPTALTDRLAQRQEFFSPRYDPFRLAVEHRTLETTRLNVDARSGAKKPFVSFTQLDEDLAPELAADKAPLEARTRELLDALGVAQMGLIREFDLCKFSFGYSRMSADPVLADKRGANMPVRLRLFEPVRTDEGSKSPIYVVQQSNEALYVRLKDEVVLAWLQALDCPDMFTLSGEEKIGAHLLACAPSMRTFLGGLPESQEPPVYLYLYTLLHSYAHLVMRHVSEYSGLDLGSLGEYIFPADLAFVVYRNGTTMDLGNLSAMWRNSGTAMLAAMLMPKSTQCGTGSLCTHRGGSCPDCTMVPETSCVAGNKLLSRSVLRSIGGRARFDRRAGAIRGYLDFAQAHPATAARGTGAAGEQACATAQGARAELGTT